MKHLLPVILLVAAACGRDAYLPDGGRPRQICQNSGTIIPITVQDSMGVPLGGAMVTATNTSTSKSVTTLTSGDGHTGSMFNDVDLGDGLIEISATSGSLKTRQPFTLQITCGECDCSVMPASATLTLQ